MDRELEIETNLKHELQSTQETLTKSRSEASNMENQLKQSKTLYTELEAEISVRAKFTGVRESLQITLDKATLSGDAVVGELFTAKELIKKTNEELQVLSHELIVVAKKRDSLHEELADVYKKVERALSDLKEENEIVSSLKKEKSLETDLEEATKALDEMNRNAMVFSQVIERANSLISRLEDEKDVVYISLTEHKIASKEAQENMEDVHNLVMRLGEERKGLEKRSKKLEEELVSAKGEILRLRSQINSSKDLVNNQQPPEEAEEPVVDTNFFLLDLGQNCTYKTINTFG
ncbi:hypothetical protein ACFX2I_046656 [Malus domestica]